MLNTLLTFITFNNPLWIDTLCTKQSGKDVFYATNIIWTDLSLCNEHLLKVLDLSGFQWCGHHISRHAFRFIIGNHLTWPTWLSLYNEEITMQTLLHKNIFSNPFSWVFLSSYLIFKPLKIETNHFPSIINPSEIYLSYRFFLLHHLDTCHTDLWWSPGSFP